jgi:hypothetical protein
MEYAPARFHKSERKLAEAGEAFAYTPENQKKFDENVARYPSDQRKSAILFALYLAQQQQGYITGAAMRFVAGQISCTPAASASPRNCAASSASVRARRRPTARSR